MALIRRDTLALPDDLAASVDLNRDAVLAVFGSEDAPTGYLTVLAEGDPETLLELWQQTFRQLAPLGYRPVLYEPRSEPGAGAALREEPRVLAPPHVLSITSTEMQEESGVPVHRSADDVLQAAAGSDVERTLLTPDRDVDPDALADRDVVADELVQLPTGPTSRVDRAVAADETAAGEPADLFLAYLKAGDPGEALVRVYLGDGSDKSPDVVDMVSILRSWHRRHGAELLQVKQEAATLELWVPDPPRDPEGRYRLGREALAFWPPCGRLWGDDPGWIGGKLAGSRVWSFSSGLGG